MLEPNNHQPEILAEQLTTNNVFHGCQVSTQKKTLTAVKLIGKNEEDAKGKTKQIKAAFDSLNLNIATKSLPDKKQKNVHYFIIKSTELLAQKTIDTLKSKCAPMLDKSFITDKVIELLKPYSGEPTANKDKTIITFENGCKLIFNYSQKSTEEYIKIIFKNFNMNKIIVNVLNVTLGNYAVMNGIDSQKTITDASLTIYPFASIESPYPMDKDEMAKMKNFSMLTADNKIWQEFKKDFKKTYRQLHDNTETMLDIMVAHQGKNKLLLSIESGQKPKILALEPPKPNPRKAIEEEKERKSGMCSIQ